MYGICNNNTAFDIHVFFATAGLGGGSKSSGNLLDGKFSGEVLITPDEFVSRSASGTGLTINGNTMTISECSVGTEENMVFSSAVKIASITSVDSYILHYVKYLFNNTFTAGNMILLKFTVKAQNIQSGSTNGDVSLRFWDNTSAASGGTRNTTA